MQPQWYVLHTKPRFELKVADQLQRMGEEVYIPTRKIIRQWSDRKKKITDPLFKSYVFIKTMDKNRERVFDVPGIIRYLYWLGKPAIVKDKEIAAIKEFLSEADWVSENDFSFLTGQQVKVQFGPFAGKEGEVLVKQGDVLLLKMEALGTFVQVRIKASWVA